MSIERCAKHGQWDSDLEELCPRCDAEMAMARHMAQHTETATPIALKFKSSNDVPVESARITAEEWQAVERELGTLQAKLTTAHLELSAERAAVAQYIGERNELQAKLNFSESVRDTLRTQLAQAQIDAEKYRQSQIGCKSPNSAEGEPDRSKPPCLECGAKTEKEAETMCICAGDKDDCHGTKLWPGSTEGER